MKVYLYVSSMLVWFEIWCLCCLVYDL